MNSKIGQNIKRLRTKQGVSQDRLSKKADVALNTVVSLETGLNGNPTIETLIKVANALNVDINELIK